MAARDMQQTLAKAREGHEVSFIPDPYRMTAPELMDLLQGAMSGRPANSIRDAFAYGFILGQRCERAEQKKKRRT